MSARDAARQAFVEAAGMGGARAAPLAGDASQRRYLRLSTPTGSAVLMDAPSDRGEDVRPFVAVTEWLRALGLSAPEILACDPEQGFLLLEDLGDRLFARVCAQEPGREPTLYGAAVDLLAERQEHPPPRLGSGACTVALGVYETAVLLREARLAPEWYLAGATGTPPSRDLLATFDGLIGKAVAPVASARDVLVLRDYHAENLIWLPERSGAARVGLLDYQDALAGHPAYDLVSLLEDARRDTAPDLGAAMFRRYLSRRRDLDPEAFAAAYAALGAQRNLKIIGIFSRLCLRDAKPHYLDLIPRVWAHLMRDLSHPDLAALRAWVVRHMPAPEPGLRTDLARRAGVPA